MCQSFKPNRILFLIILFNNLVLSEIPRLIAYQGILADSKSNPHPDGTYQFSFDMFSDSAIGTALWSQSESLVVSNGMFATLLGSKTVLSLPFNQQYWLAVSVNGKVLPPRTKLVSVAYCLRADTANVAISAKKADTATFVKNVNGGVIADSSITGADINKNSELNVLGLKVYGHTKTLSLALQGGGIYEAGSIYSDQNWGMIFRSKQSNPALAEFRWANANDNELMRIDTNGNVGINTSSPLYKLQVSGSAPASGLVRLGSGNYATATVLSVAPGTIFYDAPGVVGGRLTILGSNGNVGIGTSSPNYALEVNGSMKFAGVEIFIKGGNNGTATAREFCNGWSTTGIGLGGKRGTQYYGPDERPGLSETEDFICICMRLP